MGTLTADHGAFRSAVADLCSHHVGEVLERCSLVSEKIIKRDHTDDRPFRDQRNPADPPFLHEPHGLGPARIGRQGDNVRSHHLRKRRVPRVETLTEHSHGEVAICHDAGHPAFLLYDNSANLVVVESSSCFEHTRVRLQDDQPGPLIRSQ